MSGAIGGTNRLTLATGSTSLTVVATAQISNEEIRDRRPIHGLFLKPFARSQCCGIAEPDGDIKRLSGLNTVFFIVRKH